MSDVTEPVVVAEVSEMPSKEKIFEDPITHGYYTYHLFHI